eukprot:CAMPEP_0182420552 /NCGR_PEP_ID=MMETSP1167-20130531/5436_1 /TAXON_ID=2988 /ORGANISM="Mallomonas Sp, Strain CCMP3275" /LENGTH=737 /DNA_ID=CAMNT_0024596649 /DNA_START=178 /DNA_END=2391 /DNA_ORIENTATION=+
MPRKMTGAILQMASTNVGELPKPKESERLRRARLRLAEAQGIIPIGASDSPSISLEEIKKMPLSQSKVREISWRVAEPAVPYDPERASKRLWSQPVRWLARNVEIFFPLALFVSTVLLDIVRGEEEANRDQRAHQLLDIISAQSPALIKAAQALASRPDLLPKPYLDQLQKLQDRCPAYPSDQAIALLETELGMPFRDVFELVGEREGEDPRTVAPVAAASIGQVYRARLVSNGNEVAVKVQRPNCEEAIAVDLYIMRFYALLLQRLLAALKRDVDLVSIIDDFGELIYREIDYRAEAVNGQRFAELYASIPDVFVPKVYTDLSTSKVLTMEWVEGARLNDREAVLAMGYEPGKFVDTLVQCSLRQMLENGFFHADPHGGNLLAMSNGKLCYLDFGMVSYVEASQRLSIIEAVVHLVNRDFVSLAALYVRMGFIPQDVDPAPIILALEDALPDVLNAAVGELNFKNVISRLGDVMYKFPFSLPPFYIAIIRCLGVLEGVAIQVDKEFRIINDAYPYIASRLLTDPSSELQAALQQLLFRDGKARWERLEDLLQVATLTEDYDSDAALEQLINFLVSDQGSNIRELLSVELVEALDQVGEDALDYSLSLATTVPRTLPLEIGSILLQSRGRETGRGGRESSTEEVWRAIGRAIVKVKRPSESLLTLTKSMGLVTGGVGRVPDVDILNSIMKKVMREPVAQAFLSQLVSDLSERAAGKFVRRIFRSPQFSETINTKKSA